MGSSTHQEHLENISPVTHESVSHAIGEEQLDPHIRDDRGDPHRAALEDLDLDSKITKSTWTAIFCIAFTFQSSLTCTILLVFPILVPIALALQGSTKNVGWMASGWSLSGSIAFVVAGQLSDFFGRKNVMLFSQIVLVIGHIVGATAQSMNQAIAAMVILGLASGTTFVMFPSISELLPNKYRSIGLAIPELNVLPFSTFGPLIARAMVLHATWRWVFYLGIITGALSFVGTVIFYNPPAHPLQDRTKWQLMAELDYLGIFLYTSGVTFFLLALAWGGEEYPWNSAGVIAPLIIGLVLFVLTFAWDFSGIPKRPLLPYRLFRKFREYTSLLIILFVTGLVYITITDLIPLEIGYVFTSDTIKAGLYNIPAGFGGSIGGVVLGGMSFKIKHVQWQILVAIIIQTVFTALQTLITPETVAMGLVFQAFANMPFGWITTNAYLTAGLHIPQRDLGLALGLIGAVRFLGGAVGTTLFSTVLNNKAATTIPERVAEAVIPLGYPSSNISTLISAVSSGSESKTAGLSTQLISTTAKAIQWGYSDAFRITWLISIPFGVVACFIALFVRDPSPYFTAHTAVTLERERLGGKLNDPVPGHREKAVDVSGNQGEAGNNVPVPKDVV